MTIERPMFPPRAGKPALHLVGGVDCAPSPEPATPVPLGAPVPDDYFTQYFSMSFFKLPFVTLPQEPGDNWGEFWKRVVMWNDEPTDNASADYHRGRKYAQAAVEALATDRARSARQLEIVVECIIEGAFGRRGPKGALCRKLSSAEHGFLQGLCKIAVGAANVTGNALIGDE